MWEIKVSEAWKTCISSGDPRFGKAAKTKRFVAENRVFGSERFTNGGTEKQTERERVFFFFLDVWEKIT